MAIGSASSLIIPHAPLVSFATLAGATLDRRQALISVGLIWVFNQIYGFTLRQYPLTEVAILWGILMGLSAVAVVLIATVQPQFSRQSWWGHCLWLGISLSLGFIVCQSSVLFLNQWVGMHGLTADVMLRIFLRDGVWAIALMALHTFLAFNHHHALRRNQY